jgi:hypothetical protein
VKSAFDNLLNSAPEVKMGGNTGRSALWGDLSEIKTPTKSVMDRA